MTTLPLVCSLVWVSQLLTVGLLLGQHRYGVLHAAGEPLLVLLLLTLALLVWCGCLVARCLLLRRGWKRALVLFAVALVPVGLVMSSFAYAHRQWSKRQVPSGVRGNIAIMGGASLMEAQAKYLYPNRAESDQLVMFYLELDSPDADLKAMERHVRELVELLEKPLRAKIHWVRGPLLGQRNVSFLGLALGSDHSLDWDRQGALDRHELAHAVLNQYRLRSADPPMLLHEGWAEAKSGVGKSTLVQIAVDARSNDSNVTLADVMRGTNYRLDTGLAYTYGGAFVDFLLRHFSTPQFVDIYNRCGPETFEEDFQDVYSVSLTQLEEAFWREANQIVQRRSLPR